VSHKNTVTDIMNEISSTKLVRGRGLARNVLKELKKRSQYRSKVFKYKSIIASLITITIITVSFSHRGTADKVFVANIDDILAVKLAGPSLDQKLYRTKISLPNGIYFYSESLPEIASLRSINIKSTDILHGDFLSIALVSDEIGQKVVRIDRYDNGNKLIDSEKKKFFFHK